MNIQAPERPKCALRGSRYNRRSALKPFLPFGDGKGRQRHHAAARIADIELHQVFRLKPALVLRLHDDALHAARIREVVDIARTEIGGDRAVDVGEGNAEGICLFAVDDQHELGRIRHALRADTGDDGILRCCADQHSRRLGQCRLALRAAILEAEGKAVGRAETLDRRRRQREGRRILQAEQLHIGAV